MTHPFDQCDYQVRLDWGPVGAMAVGADVIAVVDVLSFSTAVCVAVQRGMRVFPFRWNDDRARVFAAEQDAILAIGRLEATKDETLMLPSLSPAQLLACRPVPRIVLPSPNGSHICQGLRSCGAEVIIGCLRNATAAGEYLARAVVADRSVAVVAAGERWPADGSLRPALEDQMGAGAVLHALARAGHRDTFSPEAAASQALYEAARASLDATVRDCVGGRELCLKGFGVDVEIAADVDATTVVPVLVNGAFQRNE